MEKEKTGCGCESNRGESSTSISTFDTIMPAPPATSIKISQEISEDIACCGPPPGPPASPFEKPGYEIQSWVKDFITTKAGQIPVIKSEMTPKDHLQTAFTRLNIGRNDYKVSPGLYCTGTPDEDTMVLVTSNYKLSFDHLRKELSGIDAWIVILDTRGINVWCAAGKGTFGTEELVKRIKSTGISRIVNHRKIIAPQLGATGISGREVKKQTGFSIIWGPVHTKDLPGFLKNGLKAEPEMRQVTFSLGERVVLIPVEISLTFKPAFIVMALTLLLAGIGPGIFSFTEAWTRGIPALMVLIAGIIAGTVITPVFLKQLPGTEFAVKGAVTGIAMSLPVAAITSYKTGFSGVTALVLVSVAISSFLAMNFTGTTPYTSPSGVEKEMRKAIPVQAAATIIAIILWVYSGF